MQQHGRHVLRCDWSLGRDVCQGAEKVRAVDNLPGRAVEARGSEQEYGLSGTGRDDRLVGQMGLEGKAAGAIGLHQDVVRQFRKAADGDEGGGELVVFGGSSDAEAAMAAQGRG